MRIALVLLLIGGCAWNDALVEKHIADTAPFCAKMGYAPNTDAFRDCQLKLYQSNAAAGQAAAGFALKK